MALLLALVMTTIECAATSAAAIEDTSPSLQYDLRTLLAGFSIHCIRTPCIQYMLAITFHRQTSITTQDIFLHLPAVAPCRQSNLTRPTSTLMAWPLTFVLAAGHDRSAHLSTTPARFVVCLHTALRRFVRSTIAGFSRSHMCAWRAWSGVTSQLTRMRALSHSLLSACLPTRVRWNALQRSRLSLLLTPARVGMR